jgi:hypothetical protein
MAESAEQATQQKAQAFIGSLSDEQRAQFLELLLGAATDDGVVNGYATAEQTLADYTNRIQVLSICLQMLDGINKAIVGNIR